MNLDLTDKRVLRMTLKKEFFDQIANGTKVEEYRDMSGHWISRLLEEDGSSREYDYVEFINGYAKNAPRLLVEWKGTETALYDDAPENSENPDDYSFIIQLGKVIEKTP